LQHTWQCAVSHILNVSGQNANFVCGIMDDKSLDIQTIERRINFVKDMHRYHSHNAVLCKLYMCGKIHVDGINIDMCVLIFCD